MPARPRQGRQHEPSAARYFRISRRRDQEQPEGPLRGAAAGNDGVNNELSPHTPCVPAAATDLPNKICVAATDNRDNLAGFSNFGVKHVDLSAPGVAILSTVPVLTPVFSDNFESGLGKWVTNDAGQTLPVAPAGGLSTAHAVSATHSFADLPSRNDAANQDNWARNKNGINLTGAVGCRVRRPLLSRAGVPSRFPLYPVDTDSANAASWTNTSSWTGFGNANLDNFIGFDGQSGVFFRLRLDSDATIQFDGAFVDDVAVSCALRGTR